MESRKSFRVGKIYQKVLLLEIFAYFDKYEIMYYVFKFSKAARLYLYNQLTLLKHNLITYNKPQLLDLNIQNNHQIPQSQQFKRFNIKVKDYQQFIQCFQNYHLMKNVSINQLIIQDYDFEGPRTQSVIEEFITAFNSSGLNKLELSFSNLASSNQRSEIHKLDLSWLKSLRVFTVFNFEQLKHFIVWDPQNLKQLKKIVFLDPRQLQKPYIPQVPKGLKEIKVHNYYQEVDLEINQILFKLGLEKLCIQTNNNSYRYLEEMLRVYNFFANWNQNLMFFVPFVQIKSNYHLEQLLSLKHLEIKQGHALFFLRDMDCQLNLFQFMKGIRKVTLQLDLFAQQPTFDPHSFILDWILENRDQSKIRTLTLHKQIHFNSEDVFKSELLMFYYVLYLAHNAEIIHLKNLKFDDDCESQKLDFYRKHVRFQNLKMLKVDVQLDTLIALSCLLPIIKVQNLEFIQNYSPESMKPFLKIIDSSWIQSLSFNFINTHDVFQGEVMQLVQEFDNLKDLQIKMEMSNIQMIEVIDQIDQKKCNIFRSLRNISLSFGSSHLTIAYLGKFQTCIRKIYNSFHGLKELNLKFDASKVAQEIQRAYYKWILIETISITQRNQHLKLTLIGLAT